MMFAVDVCDLPATGGSTFVLVAGVFLLVAGLIVTRWVWASAGRMSVVVAPFVLLGGLVLAPSVTDPCAPTTTAAPTTTTTTAAPPTTTTTAAPTTTTTTAAPTTTTTTAAPVVYSVGDPGPSGGIVFYDAGSAQQWGRYLEAACAGWSDGICGGSDLTDPQYPWGCMYTPITGADGKAIGTGEQNTDDIVAGCTTADFAAQRAKDLVMGGQSDWFLPSNDELNLMYNVKTAISSFASNQYWSSSEADSIYAWYQDLTNGYSSANGGKDAMLYVRPARAF